MSIAREYGKFIPTCDGCSDALDEEWDFDDARNAMKIAGWRTTKAEDGEWANYCPTCLDKGYATQHKPLGGRIDKNIFDKLGW